MKRVIYILFLVIPALVCSCNLDQFPESEVGKGSAVKNEAGLNKLLVGCYNALHEVMYYEWAVTEVRSDNTRLRSTGSSSTETITIQQLDGHIALSSNKYIQDYWDATFRGIYRSNDVIANLGVASAANRPQYEGQALFMRANYYFNLVRLWGPMFLVENIKSIEDYLKLQRSSVDDVYVLIERDLKKIIDENMLPEKYTSNETGRATLVAAKALLAKVYMTHYGVGSSQYLLAKPLLESVLSSVGNPQNATQLVPFADVFDITKEMNKEIIFAVRYMSGLKGVGSPFGNLFAPVDSKDGTVINGGTSSMNYPSTDIINAFKSEAGDKRLDISLREGFFNAIGVWIETDGGSRYVNKFMSKPTNPFDSDNDWPVIRVADVILLYAEVMNETGNAIDALRYLNMTRERAGLVALTGAEVSSKFEFRQALKHERRLELAFENHRLYDLMRWGDALTTLNSYFTVEVTQAIPAKPFYTGTTATERSLLLPIPLAVTNVNIEATQNPGY